MHLLRCPVLCFFVDVVGDQNGMVQLGMRMKVIRSSHIDDIQPVISSTGQLFFFN